MEALTRSHAFNQLGGLQLDKDVRVLLSFFASRAPGANARRHFARLSQVRRHFVVCGVSFVVCGVCGACGVCGICGCTGCAVLAWNSHRLPVRSLARSLARSSVRLCPPPPHTHPQMALLLNLDRPSDVYDYWGGNAGSMVWRLSVAEVKEVMGQRVEWQQLGGEVEALQLG